MAPVKSNLILMAEDDSDDQLLVQDALAETGFGLDLRFVSNGVELMDYLRQKNGFNLPGSSPPPGLIILDLNMPRKEGREALPGRSKGDPELKENSRRRADNFRRRNRTLRGLMKLGANSFISRPAAFDLLVNTVEKHRPVLV